MNRAKFITMQSIILLLADIAAVAVSAIVNPANTSMLGGSGYVALSIKSRRDTC